MTIIREGDYTQYTNYPKQLVDTRLEQVYENNLHHSNNSFN